MKTFEEWWGDYESIRYGVYKEDLRAAWEAGQKYYQIPVNPELRKQNIGCSLPCSEGPTEVCPGVHNCPLCQDIEDGEK